ncbi:GFA family protein [Marinilactibacillus piezotolerans]|uniref:GFA family protein n=1 Tax=Marinilactibacillus piezotolerans TaxID=258723 RepID=UPI0009B13DF8|nr:GFA family protein [Marinilactibacillus piezotolerans]
MIHLTGHCLCQKTTLEINCTNAHVTACHCGMCRTQTAGPMFYTQKVEKEAYTFTKSEFVKVYASSEFAERGFCSNCGTVLFFRNQESQRTSFNPELFPELIEQATFNDEIYYADKPEYYTFQNATSKRQ